MSTSTRTSFRQDDIKLLQTGHLSDGTVKCKARTWKVHRVLLASRLKFFEVAFYRGFKEATTGEVEFPESDPDLVDIMLRHLYGEGINIRDLKTPALCIRCWRLADYVQLESLKTVANSLLEKHLDAMALLASSNYWDNLFLSPPKWISHFLDALHEVGHDDTTEPLYNTFATFLWVTRFELLRFDGILYDLEQCDGVNKKLIELLTFQEFLGDYQDVPNWVETYSCKKEIANRKEIDWDHDGRCDECNRSVGDTEIMFYNPFPVNHRSIGELRWCKGCVDKFNEECSWPWRSGGRIKGGTIKLEAWDCFGVE